jgi:hypothetical protein
MMVRRTFTENYVKKAPIQALIYGLQENSAAVRVIVFNVDRTKLPLGELDVVIDDNGGCPGSCGPRGLAIVGIGSYFHAVDHLGRYSRVL